MDVPGDGRADRARGALVGLALGDALGMPTQLLSRDQVRDRWPRLVWFEAGPADSLLAPSVPAGTVTDDTEQALVVARELLEDGGRVDPDRLAGRLAEWADRATAAGGLEVLGPSSARALAQYRRTGTSVGAGRYGDTNGAAMRICPVGIVCRPEPLEALVDLVAAVDQPTHDTRIAHAGAAAVARAVSAGIEGVAPDQILPLALAAAAQGARRGHVTPGPDVAARIAWACGLAAAADAPLDVIELLVGTSVATQESVPAAFAIATTYADPWQACLAAAALGGDADTIAAMVGAMVGARHGLSAFPADAVAALTAANPTLDLIGTADDLLAARPAPARSAPARPDEARPAPGVGGVPR